MLNFVETVLPIRTSVAVCLVVSLAVDTFEEIRVRLTFLYSKLWRIYVVVFFAASYLLLMMLEFVKSIAFDASGHM